MSCTALFGKIQHLCQRPVNEKLEIGRTWLDLDFFNAMRYVDIDGSDALGKTTVLRG